MPASRRRPTRPALSPDALIVAGKNGRIRLLPKRLPRLALRRRQPRERPS